MCEERDGMVIAWRFAIHATCRAGSNTACGRFPDKYYNDSTFSTLGLFVSLGKVLYPHILHLTYV